jgi:hypothetical protein
MTMTWTSIATKDVPAGVIDAPWIAITDPFEDFDHLLIEAEGEWALFGPPGLACGPDGIAGVPVDAASLVVSACRPGALIGKLGGSSAARNTAAAEAPPAEGATTPPPYSPASFAIGTRAIIPVPDTCYGPLFIGFNLAAGAIELKALKLSVKGAKLA